MKVEDRALTPLERAVLEAVLSVEFDGAKELRSQVPSLVVCRKCDCGCPTVEFRARSDAHEVILQAEGRYPSNEPNGPPGEVIVFERDGMISSLEYVYYDGNPPSEFPDPADLEVWAR